LVRGANSGQLWNLSVQLGAMAESESVRETNLKWRKGLPNEIWYSVVKVQIYDWVAETKFKCEDSSFGICFNRMQASV
jgi:hypothetical protein